MTAIAFWKADIRVALADVMAVFEELYCYAPGKNFVSDANIDEDRQTCDVVIPTPLQAFYSEVREVSMPDIYIGYFIYPLEIVCRSDCGHPKRVEVEIGGNALNEDVVTFGSDGGGALFCISRSNGAIYDLPPGRIDENNVYSAGLCQPRLVALSFEEFLQRLLNVTKDFATAGSARL
jgi:hypothetical protein